MATDPYAICEEMLQREDKDRWLATLFLPAETRPFVQALYAFSLEIGRVRRLVSEPALGEIRFQWWREVLAGERAGEAASPSGRRGRARHIGKNDLPPAPLLALIDARLFDLSDEPMPTLADLEAYAIATAGQLFQLGALILDPRRRTTLRRPRIMAGSPMR